MFPTQYFIFAQQPIWTSNALFIKQEGGHSVAVLGYGVSPSSKASALAEVTAAKSVGLKVPYVNVSLPFGTVNVVPIALQLKSASVDSYDAPIEATLASRSSPALNRRVRSSKYSSLLRDTGRHFSTTPRLLPTPRMRISRRPSRCRWNFTPRNLGGAGGIQAI
jgi:hypothetical protein